MQVPIILSLLSLWLLVVSIFLFRFLVLFNKLTKGVEVPDLKKVLEKILSCQVKDEKEMVEIKKRIDSLEKDGLLHIQKIGLVRFNPFKELGGDHSFSLAVLDGEENGFIMTSLHTRDRTRVYMKRIVGGKADADLSDEEKKALAKAR